MIFERAFSGDVRPENPKEHEATTEEIIGKLEEKLESLDRGTAVAEKALEDAVAVFERTFESATKGEVNPESGAARVSELKKDVEHAKDVIGALRAEAERARVLIVRMKEIKAGREDELLEVSDAQKN